MPACIKMEVRLCWNIRFTPSMLKRRAKKWMPKSLMAFVFNLCLLDKFSRFLSILFPSSFELNALLFFLVFLFVKFALLSFTKECSVLCTVNWREVCCFRYVHRETLNAYSATTFTLFLPSVTRGNPIHFKCLTFAWRQFVGKKSKHFCWITQISHVVCVFVYCAVHCIQLWEINFLDSATV